MVGFKVWIKITCPSDIETCQAVDKLRRGRYKSANALMEMCGKCEAASIKIVKRRKLIGEKERPLDAGLDDCSNCIQKMSNGGCRLKPNRRPCSSRFHKINGLWKKKD